MFQTHKKRKQQYIRPFPNVLLDFVFMDFFPSVPRCAPLGHLLKWLLSSYFLFHFKSLHIIHLTAGWKTARDSPVYRFNVAPQSKFFCASLCEKKSTLAVPDCWLKMLITELWHCCLAPQAPDPPNWFSVFKRAHHQRCDCQSACFYFQIHLSLLFITDKQTF